MMTPLKYMMKTEPYQHQEDEFDNHHLDRERAIFWEMGVGKSKLIIDSACALYHNDLINAVIILAPNIVHSNWTLREFPTHAWESVQCAYITWDSKRAKSKKFAKDVAYTMVERNNFNHRRKLLVIAMNYEALRGEKAEEFLKGILDSYSVMFVCDESSRIKSYKAQVSKTCMKLGRLAVYRRILTGTPYTTGPFDIYSQMRFLSPDHLGYKTYTAFKTRYGVFQTEYITRMVKGVPKEATYQSLVEYRNLNDLTARMAPISTRLTKFDCLDLPDRIYQKYEVEMTSKQRALYDTLRAELILHLEHDGKVSELITENALSLLMRLQQITGGFIPHDDQVLPCDKVNPKITIVKELVEDILASGNQVVIWARFQAEIDALIDALCPQLRLRGSHRLVEFHGRVSDEDKSNAIDSFQSGDAQVLIGNQASGGMGITLTAACYMIYFSNSFSLDQRLQSEARIHRIGQTQRCTYIDINAKGSVDQRIRERLRENKDLAEKLTGDEVREWLT